MMVRFGFAAIIGTVVASDFDESSLMQMRLATKSSLFDSTGQKLLNYSGPFYTLGKGTDCGRDFNVINAEMCETAAKALKEESKGEVLSVKGFVEVRNNTRGRGPSGCVLHEGPNRVYWHENDRCAERDGCGFRSVCLQQAAKSEWCAEKVCEVKSFAPEDLTHVLDVATGNRIPETLRGLWFMDGNPMPDAVLSLQIDFTEEPGDLLVGKLHHSSNAIALHDTEQGKGLFTALESTQPNYYEFRCQYGNNDTNNIEACTISVSVLGSPVIPTMKPFFEWTMVPMSVDDPNHIREDGSNKGEQLTMSRGSTMFGKENTYYARRIVDQHGQRLQNNWDHFVKSMQEQGHDSLAYIHNTHAPAPAPDPLKVRMGTILASAVHMALSDMDLPTVPKAGFSRLEAAADAVGAKILDAVDAIDKIVQNQEPKETQEVQEVKRSKNQHSQPLVPTDDRYETMTSLVGRCDQRGTMARLNRAFELGTAMGETEGRENPMMSGLASVVERLLKMFLANVWEQAYEDGGRQPINPASDNFILRDSPLPYPLSALLFTWEEIIEITTGLMELPLFQMPFHANGNRTYYFSQFAQQNCFEIMPLGSGPQVFKYEKVSADMADRNQSRGYFTATSDQHKSIFNVDLPLFLSSGSDQHTEWRQALEDTQFARKVPVPLKLIKQVVNWSPLVNGTVDTAMIAKAVFPFTQMMLWGKMPDATTVAAVAPYLKEGTLGIFGKTVHNLITGLRHKHGEPSMTENLIGYRKTALAWVKSTGTDPESIYSAMKDSTLVREYIDKHPGLVAIHPFNEQLGYDTEEDHFFMNIVDATLFAGYIGTTDLTDKCVRYQQNNSEMQDLFKEDPEAFIIELMRYDGAVTSFTALYKEDTEEIIEGKKLEFKKGTPYQASLLTANRDPTEFEEPAQFNTRRANIGNQLSWNGKLKDVESRDLVKAPRHCPGYCLSLKLGAALCAQFMGSFDELEQNEKLTADINCNRFNNDCQGAWSEWSECSAPCSGGVKTRTFSGAPADSPTCMSKHGQQETAACNIEFCEEECEKIEGQCVKHTSHSLTQLCAAQDPTLPLKSDAYMRFAREALVSKKIVPDELIAMLTKLSPELGENIGGLLGAVPNVENELATADEETMDRFLLFVNARGMSAGPGKVKSTGPTIPIPMLTGTQPCLKRFGWCIPINDIDDVAFQANATENMQSNLQELCAFNNINTFAFTDDLDVQARNRWELVLSKPKFQTPEITTLLGHNFSSKLDWVTVLWEKHIASRRLGSGEIHFQQIFHMDAGNSWKDSLEHFLAFKYVFSHRVEAVSESDAVIHAKYKVSTAKYQAIPVRSGFAKLGSEMFFNAEGFPILVKIGDQDIGPNDGEAWQYAKFHWRASTFTVITLEDHLLGAHMHANLGLASASREVLPSNHPLRRLLTRYTADTIAVNRQAANSLVQPRSVLDRSTPFADFSSAVQTALDTFTPAKSTLSMVRDVPLDKFLQEMPFVQDGHEVYDLNSGLIKGFFESYDWCSDDRTHKDKDVKAFATRLKNLTPATFLELDADDCVGLVDDLAAMTFYVSAFHTHAGNSADITEDPEMMAFSWPEGQPYGLPKQMQLLQIMNHGTAHNKHAVFTDAFTQLCGGIDNEAKCKANFDDFQTKAEKLSESISERNKHRTLDRHATPYHCMDPKYVESMVAK